MTSNCGETEGFADITFQFKEEVKALFFFTQHRARVHIHHSYYISDRGGAEKVTPFELLGY